MSIGVFSVPLFLNNLKISNKIEIGKHKLRVPAGEGKKFRIRRSNLHIEFSTPLNERNLPLNNNLNKFHGSKLGESQRNHSFKSKPV